MVNGVFTVEKGKLDSFLELMELTIDNVELEPFQLVSCFLPQDDNVTFEGYKVRVN